MDSKWDLDNAAWSRLHQVGGNEFAIELVSIFLDHTPRVLSEARAAFNAGNFEPIQRAGHTLKSNCGHLGALAMRDVAVRLERAAAAKETDAIPVTLLELEDAFACVRVHLEEKRRNMA